MGTEQYAMVRGRVIRITALSSCGSLPDTPGRYVVANCVAKVGVNEVIEAGSNEVVRDVDDEPMLHHVRETELLGHTADIDFLKVDPGAFELVSGNPPVYGWAGESLGFGEMPFGEGPFGGPEGTIIGFDQQLRRRANTAFALEIWSYIANQVCDPGERKWGYTLFPFLKGGHLSGFEFSNTNVSFSLVGAQSRRGSGWGEGPYEFSDGQRLPSPVNPLLSWRNFIYVGTPPSPTNGIQTFTDVVDNGNADDPHPFAAGTVDGGAADTTSSDIIQGGNAA